jgi:hypothetical protein
MSQMRHVATQFEQTQNQIGVRSAPESAIPPPEALGQDAPPHHKCVRMPDLNVVEAPFVPVMSGMHSIARRVFAATDKREVTTMGASGFQLGIALNCATEGSREAR